MKNNILLLLLVLSSAIFACNDSTSSPTFKNGDIIFQSNKSDFAKAIKLATQSNYSHVGVLLFEDDQWVVYEAVGPVKKTPIKQWLANGTNNEYAIKRLSDSLAIDSLGTVKLKNAIKPYLGKAYDMQFNWSDEKMYCSEFVFKVFEDAFAIQLGELKPLKSYSLSKPEVKKQLRLMYGDALPYNELMVSPQSIFESEYF